MHHNIFWWLSVLCAFASVLILYVQVAFGEDDHRLRGQIGLWASTIKSDWRALPAFAVLSTDRLLSRIFGSSLISFRYIASICLLGLTVNYIAYQIEVGSTIVSATPHHLVSVSPGDWPLLILNTIIDAVFLAIGRTYLRWAVDKPRQWLLLYLVAPIAFLAFSMTLSMFGGALLGSDGHPGSMNGTIELFHRFSYWALHPGEDPSAAAAQWLYFGPAASSSLFLGIAYFTCITIYVLRPVIQRPLEKLLGWLSTRKVNLIALAGSVLTVVTAFSGLFMG